MRLLTTEILQQMTIRKEQRITKKMNWLGTPMKVD